MHQERKNDLSVYYFISDLFSDVNYITVVDDFPTSNLQIPTISVVGKTIEPIKFEMGNRDRLSIRVWYLEIFAKNKTQRDEIAYRILDALEDCIPVYDYDDGFPPDISPSNIGCLEVENIKMEIIRIIPELVDKLYYRAVISFTASYNRF